MKTKMKNQQRKNEVSSMDLIFILISILIFIY